MIERPPITIEELEKIAPLEVWRESAAREADLRKKRQRYLTSPWMWLKYVCTPEDKRDMLNGDLHGGGLAFVNGPKRRKLILWPRGHLKSTVFTQSEALRRAVANPNMRILISSMKWDNAKTYLTAIKGIMQTKEFIELYGDLLPPPNSKYHKNNDAELTLMSRTNLSIREATFSTTGIDKEKTGQHYDLIIHDDVVGRDNISNEAMMLKVITYYRDCVSLLDPKREMWVIGTRWHPNDLYGFLLDGTTDPRCMAINFESHVPDCVCAFEVSIRQLVEKGKYIYPEKFDDEVVNDLIKSDQLDKYSFACQYYNNPADQSSCWFQASDIDAALINPNEVKTYIDAKGKEVKRDLVWYTAIDPAESSNSRACLSAAVAVGVDQADGTWYVDWAEGRRVETPGFLDLAMETYRRYRPVKFGMELHTKRSLEFSLKRRMLDDNMTFNIEELKPQKVGDATRTKDERIKRLLPIFEGRKIRINRSCKQLLDELYLIPASTTRDMTDALSYIMDLVPPGMGSKQGNTIRLPRRHVQFAGTGY